MTNKKIEITQKGLDKLQKELEERQNIIRKDLQDQLDEELKAGDISENASYYRIQEEIGSNQKRIDDLETLIKQAVVIKHDGNSDKNSPIGVGSTVTLKKDNLEITYKIVGTTETDPIKNKISIKSPIGTALAGKKTGDHITVNTPTGPIKYDIIATS